MNAEASHLDADLRVAECVLTQSFGGIVRLAPGQDPRGGSGRASVRRCAVLDGPSGIPASVIVKKVNLAPGQSYDPAAPDGPAANLFNEWASLQFLSELTEDSRFAPRFYGGERAAGLIVMEDLGRGESLVEALLSDDRAKAETTLDIYFRSLGRLHATTHGHSEAYWRLRDNLGPRQQPQPTLDYILALLRRYLQQVCDVAGITPAPGTDEDLIVGASFEADPGPFLALSQSDTCPDNCMREGEWMRFLDFEGGRFRNAFSDGARARSNFPTCWLVNRLPDDAIRRTEAVYQAELSKGCPQAADDTLFYREVVKACASWTLASFEFYNELGIWQEDRQWGAATTRQRAITRFQLLAQTTAQFGFLEALGATAQRLAVALQKLWPEVAPMPYYRPFR